MNSDICWLGNKVFCLPPISQGTGTDDPINSNTATSNAATSNAVKSNAMGSASKTTAITPSTVYPVQMTPTVPTTQAQIPAAQTTSPIYTQSPQATGQQPETTALVPLLQQQAMQPSATAGDQQQLDASQLAQLLTMFQQGPPLSTDVGYIPYYLATNIGKNVRAEFILGSSQYSDKVGRLIEVGINYFVLEDVNSRTHIMCDLYSVKFVTVLQE